MKKLHYLLLLLPTLVLAQSNSQNYIKTKAYKVASTTSIADSDSSAVAVSITYFDGLGRPIQQVARMQSPLGKDIVIPIVYDSVGRRSKEYLPLASNWNDGRFTDNNTVIAGIISDYSARFGTDGASPYSEKVYDNSPLNRVLAQGAPGEDWKIGNGHTVNFDYTLNSGSASHPVYRYTAVSVWDGAKGMYVPSLAEAGANAYAANSLIVNTMRDENWTGGTDHTTEEYKNLEGQVLLKRKFDGLETIDTYNIYDQFGNLTYVIPPSVSGTLTKDILDNQCYQYVYDERNRIVEKKSPGTAWEFIVYDKLDRVTATGPALAPSPLATVSNNVGWLITKYDLFNRVVYTGWNVGTVSSAVRKTMQVTNNGASTINETRVVSRTIDGKTVYYTNDVLPVVVKLLTVNYYDNYSFPNVAPTPTAPVEGQTIRTASQTKGMLTGQFLKIYGAENQMKGNYPTYFYDRQGRQVQKYTTFYISGGYRTFNTKYDFAGKVLYNYTLHRRATGATPVAVWDYYSYTAVGRLDKITQKIGNNGPVELLQSNTYDALGRLTRKKVGGTDLTGTNALQYVHYKYNIRGWMTGINDADDLTIGSDPKDLFAMGITYNDGSAPLYNGNIARIDWQTGSDDKPRRYDYVYDPLNRLLDATYSKPAENTAYDYYGEHIDGYDKNGNIIGLVRNGGVSDTGTFVQPIDELVYVYDALKPNQLLSVNEAPGGSSIAGFIDGNTTGNDYAYDDYGNMTSDANKHLSITYNHMNLPHKVSFVNGDKIEYFYDSQGTKVLKIVTQGSTVTTTDYIEGGVQYTNGVLDFMQTAEGYVKNTVVGGNNNFNYVFNYTDHLGNVRLSYAKDPVSGVKKIIEENNYYPYGLKHEGYNPDKLYFANGGSGVLLQTAGAKSFEYKLNGKEWQDDLGLNVFDMDLRDYDPAIARWVNMDPIIHFGQSAYNAFDGNPVVYADPSGGSADNQWLQGFDGEWHHVDGSNFDEIYNSESASGEGYQSSSYSEDGEAASSSAGGEWQDLTKDIIREYALSLHPNLSGGQLENFVGRMFENSWNAVAGLFLSDDNYEPNNNKMSGGTRTTVPDGTADGIIRKGFKDIVVKNAAWFEVKAKNGDIYNSTSTGQTLGHLTNLAFSIPLNYRKDPVTKASAASLTFITTSNVSISPKVFALATLLNITVYQYTAQYRNVGGLYNVRFMLSNINGVGTGNGYVTPSATLH